MEIILLLLGIVAGIIIAAYRLRGDRTTAEALRAVIHSGGGPRPSRPR